MAASLSSVAVLAATGSERRRAQEQRAAAAFLSSAYRVKGPDLGRTRVRTVLRNSDRGTWGQVAWADKRQDGNDGRFAVTGIPLR